MISYDKKAKVVLKIFFLLQCSNQLTPINIGPTFFRTRRTKLKKDKFSARPIPNKGRCFKENAEMSKSAEIDSVSTKFIRKGFSQYFSLSGERRS